MDSHKRISLWPKKLVTNRPVTINIIMQIINSIPITGKPNSVSGCHFSGINCKRLLSMFRRNFIIRMVIRMGTHTKVPAIRYLRNTDNI